MSLRQFYPTKEVNILFNIIRMLKKEKTTIIYISHRLEEVFELSVQNCRYAGWSNGNCA